MNANEHFVCSRLRYRHILKPEHVRSAKRVNPHRLHGPCRCHNIIFSFNCRRYVVISWSQESRSLSRHRFASLGPNKTPRWNVARSGLLTTGKSERQLAQICAPGERVASARQERQDLNLILAVDSSVTTILGWQIRSQRKLAHE